MNGNNKNLHDFLGVRTSRDAFAYVVSMGAGGRMVCDVSALRTERD